MHRRGTWFVVAAICGLALVAAVDAFRGGEEPGSQTVADQAPPKRSAAEAANAAAALRQQGIRGVLTYSDPACGVHALRLPDLAPQPAPAGKSCRFVSSVGVFSLGPAVPDPNAVLSASCDRGTLELRSSRTLIGRVHACAPAWKPSGTLTGIRNGELVDLDIDAAHKQLVPRVVLSRHDLARSLARDPWDFRSPALAEVAWLTDTRVAAIVTDRERRLDILAFFRGRTLVTALPSPYSGLSRLRVSPSGSYVAARIEDPRALLLVDGRGRYVALGFRSGRAITWSPDERWTAVATGDGVYVFPTGERAVRLTRLPLEASDLFWQ